MQQHRQDKEVDSFTLPKYVPFSGVRKWRKIDPPITLHGKKTGRYQRMLIAEYVDTETGEILPEQVVRNDPKWWPTIHSSERCMQRDSLLQALRPEVREFALFVLKFRNQRRGVTPGIPTLVKRYAHLTGKQVCHVRRYVKALEDGGITAGESLLAPLFMIAGKSATVRDHLVEDSNASAGFLIMLLKQRDVGQVSFQPEWEKHIEFIPTEDRTTGRIGPKLRALIDYVRALIQGGQLGPQFA